MLRARPGAGQQMKRGETMRRALIVAVAIASAGLLLAAQAESAPPAPPSSISVTAPPGQNGDTLRIVFGASADDGSGNDDVTRYVVERQDPSNPWQALPDVPATGASSYTIDDSGLTKNTSYTYRVAADNGALSTRVQATAKTRDQQRPGAPGLDAADRPGDQGSVIVLTIAKSPDDGGGANDVLRYQIMRRSGGGAFQFLRVVLATGAATYTVNDRVEQKNQLYYYKVQAYDGRFYSDPAFDSASGRDNIKPRPPGVEAADRPDDQGFVIIVTIGASPDDGAGADDVVSYRIMRRVSGGTFTFLRNVPANDQPQYVVTDRVDLNKKRYDYKVKAFDGTLYSDAAFASATGTDNLKPRAPRGLQVVDVPGDQGKALLVKFSRSPDDGIGVGDVRRYRISRRPPGGTFTSIALLRANGSETYQYTDYGLQPDTRYTYRVVAWDGRNTSDPVFASGKTVDNRAPRPPSALKVTDRPNDNGDALILTFDASPDDGAKANDVREYQIFRNPGPVSGEGLGLVGKVPATAAASYTYTDTGLTRNRKYNYVVRAFDGKNLSTSITGSGTPLDNKAPRPPGTVTVTDVPNDNGGVVTVSFVGSPDDGAGANDVVSYEVLRKRAGGAYAPLETISATDSQLYTFTDTGLVNGVDYVYSVRAYDGTRYSTPVFGRGQALDNTAPRPPKSFAVAAVNDAAGAADVSFGASDDDTPAHPEVTQYEIYRKRAGQSWPGTPTLTVAAKQAATYVARDSGLTVGATYYYKARAKAPTGFSKWTPWRTLVAVDSRKPAPPRNLKAADRPDDTGQAVIVQWDRSGDDGTGRNIVAKYIVYRKLTSVFDSPATRVRVVAATGAASYELLDASSELMNLRSYTYWAVAVSATGVQSDNSNEAEAVPRNDTILAAPTNLTAVDHAGNGNAIDLAWNRSSSEGGVGPPPPPPFGVQGSDGQADTTGDYEVFRRRSGQAWPTTPYMTVPASIQGSPIQVTDTQAPNGVTFDYKVRYRISTAISPFSNTATATARNDGSSTASTAGLSVEITQAPTSVAAGQPVAITAQVESEELSAVRLEWRVNNGLWQKATGKTGRGTYEATFTLMPGGVQAGDALHVVAVASDATDEAKSEEVKIEITR
jgi:hypothetical protein